MGSLQLVHLTYAGSGKPTAQIVFGPELTTIYGASDTGKTFIVRSVEYMLGGSQLPMVPEAEGYTQILLGLLLPDGSPLTLVRRPGTNSTHLHREDLRDLVHRPADAIVNSVHNARSKNSLSIHLMRAMGLDEVLIRKNEAGGTRSLTLTDLVHLSVVTEDRMIAMSSPVLRTGTASTRTAETSVMRFLLTGEGDPDIDTGPNPGQRRVNRGQINLLDQLVIDLHAKLESDENERELKDRLVRVKTAISAQTTALRVADESHREAVRERMAHARRLAGLDERLAEVSDLLGRFRLLEDQYRSDLERLVMVNEAGSILGYFRVGTCVFCGAHPEHQHPGHRQQEATQLHIAVQAEAEKTTALLTDLLPTIADLAQEQQEITRTWQAAKADLETLDARISEVEGQLVPLREGLQELLDARSAVERGLELHARITELEDKRSRIDGEGAVPAARPTEYIAARVVNDFDSVLRHTLGSWEVPAVDNSGYDQYNAEIRAGGRPRAGRGKGVRSVLHSAFTTSLARFCIERDLPHLGFVVLDSPVVTYRQPVKYTPQDPDVPDARITSTVVERFYEDMLAFPGQAVIIENGDPPLGVLSEATTYNFTAADGRPGFLL
ncbi:hypothetical protein GCM10010222_66120 [Streptomyces tanashiensis]|uniref:hypothetical protein n=1 Tax=Streptomyces tanashiensis TaxID=67367 RepID=UPI001672A057|nr:hypothetical protein [Streptomyces tanashiensis]GGT14850.1 hypothetical protein GCM10010222_66120 [Streptomyces tanashiensis]